MIFQFLLLSDEVDDFQREIQIASDNSFLELHSAILKATGFGNDEMASFFVCEDDWSKKTEVTLVDMGAPPDADTYLMEDTRLEDLLEDEHQKLLFVFDYLAERALFIELNKIVPNKFIDQPVCTLSTGNPPPQTIPVHEVDKYIDQRVDPGLGEVTLYGEDDFNEDELDHLTGFDGNEDNEETEPYFDDDRF